MTSSIVGDGQGTVTNVSFDGDDPCHWADPTSRHRYSAQQVDEMLAAGAKVLRHGYGEDGQS